MKLDRDNPDQCYCYYSCHGGQKL